MSYYVNLCVSTFNKEHDDDNDDDAYNSRVTPRRPGPPRLS